jgi:glycosyltransferase involved in cell wall biosynthesis
MAVPWPRRPLIGNFHVLQARALAERGCRMDLFGPAPRVPAWLGHLSQRVRGHVKRPLRYEIDGVTIHSPRVPFAFPPTLRFQGARVAPRAVTTLAHVTIARALRKCVQTIEPDALVVHGALPLGPLVADVARERGLPWICIEHSADDVMRLERSSALGRCYVRTVRRARALVAVGRPMVEHLRSELGMSGARYLPNGAVRPTRDQFERPRPHELRGARLVLAAGKYYRRKGFEELVDAWMKRAEPRPSDRLVLATAPPESLHRHIEARRATSSVRILGLLPQVELIQWMCWADVFALPSWSEAFGLVYAEALGCGTPVILTRDCGLAHDVETAGAGWVVAPRSTESLAHALTEATRDEAERVHRGEVGRRLVERRYTWDRNAAALLEALGARSAAA